MDNFSTTSTVYLILFLSLLPVIVILLICKKIAVRKGREQLADVLRRITLICAVTAAAAMLFASFSVMFGISEYFSKGH
ncbi:MAG: hypothetical protein IKQ91_08170 [Oscillospiraceae bacterium]|nr:hypothetical protein [Oscillospiraceae bacterium]